MKIGLVIERFDPTLGGVEQWTYQYVQWLVARGHDVHVLARKFGPAIDPIKLTRHVIEAPSSRLAFGAAVERTLPTLQLDVVHDTGCGWACDVVQPHGGARRASFEQNLLLAPRWLRPIKRWLAPRLARYRDFEQLTDRQYRRGGPLVMAISQMVAHDLQKWHCLPAERLRLIYNGVDLKRFSPKLRDEHRAPLRAKLGIGEEEVLLLIVAHNFALKGVPTLERAVKRLHGEGWPVRLAIAGGKKGPGARLSEVIHYLGSVSDASPYYAAADVYVQPTFYDPCSLVVLEALAAGLPTITSRFNGAGELMTPGQEGYLVDDPADDEELCGRLRPLFDAQRREIMGRAARRLAEKHSLERNFSEILALYGEISRVRVAA